jgi:hypothetical protein
MFRIPDLCFSDQEFFQYTRTYTVSSGVSLLHASPKYILKSRSGVACFRLSTCSYIPLYVNMSCAILLKFVDKSPEQIPY